MRGRRSRFSGPGGKRWLCGACSISLQFGQFYRPKGENRTAQAFRPGKVHFDPNFLRIQERPPIFVEKTACTISSEGDWGCRAFVTSLLYVLSREKLQVNPWAFLKVSAIVMPFALRGGRDRCLIRRQPNSWPGSSCPSPPLAKSSWLRGSDGCPSIASRDFLLGPSISSIRSSR
jgi:hypothetical protein